MKNGRADQPGPAPEWTGYSYNSTDENKKRYEERKRLYPTPRADAEWATVICAKPARAPKRKPAGF